LQPRQGWTIFTCDVKECGGYRLIADHADEIFGRTGPNVDHEKLVDDAQWEVPL
jgi:hypothetical protein